MGLNGVGMAGCLTNIIMFSLLIFQKRMFFRDMDMCNVPIDERSFKGLKDYLKIGIPTAFGAAADWLAAELNLIITAKLSIID